MPLSSLPSDLSERLSQSAPAAAWRRHLSEAGLLAPVPDGPPGSPPARIRAAQGALAELEAAEDALAAARALNPLAGVKLPDAVWVLLGAALLFLILFAEVAIAWLGDAAIWGGLALAIGVATWTVLERRVQDPTLAPRLAEARRGLRAAVNAVQERSFVLQTERGLVVSLPQLDTLRGMAEALAAADPDAPLVADLRAEIDAVQARVDALVASPPDGWTDRGLAPDVERWQAAIDRTGG